MKLMVALETSESIKQSGYANGSVAGDKKFVRADISARGTKLCEYNDRELSTWIRCQMPDVRSWFIQSHLVR